MARHKTQDKAAFQIRVTANPPARKVATHHGALRSSEPFPASSMSRSSRRTDAKLKARAQICALAAVMIAPVELVVSSQLQRRAPTRYMPEDRPRARGASRSSLLASAVPFFVSPESRLLIPGNL